MSAQLPKSTDEPVLSMLERLNATPDELRMLDDDRAWFAAHPDREFRVRGPMLGDIMDDGVIDPRDRIIVRLIHRWNERSSYRMRIPFNPIAGEDTASEAGCAAIWRRMAEFYPSCEEKCVLALREAAKAIMVPLEHGQ